MGVGGRSHEIMDFEEMKEKGLGKNAVAYGAMISTFADAGQFEDMKNNRKGIGRK